MNFICSIINYIKRHKYIFIFMFIFLSFLPYFFHFYPGIVISDTWSQLNQILGIEPVCNHHPIFQTFLWSIFMRIGNFFNNDNITIVINSLFQIISMSLVFTYSIYYLNKIKINTKFLVFIYAFYPIFGIFSVYTTKDTMFGVSILFYVIELSKLIDNPKETFSSKINIFLLIISSVLVILFRNQGIFVVLITLFLAMIFLRKYIKQILSIFLFIIALFIFWNNIVFNIFNVKTTEKVESLSIPLLQINYIVYHNFDKLDSDIISRISKFIDVDLLKENYVYRKIDCIKGSFNEDYYNDHKIDFFVLSFDLLRNYPSESFESFWLKNKKFFNPFTSFKALSIYVKDEMPLDVTMNPIFEFSIIDFIVDDLISDGFNNKKFLFNPSISFYLILLLYIYCLLKNRKYMIILTSVFIVWFSILLSPSSVYRYVFPIILCSPYLIYYILKIENRFGILLHKIGCIH